VGHEYIDGANLALNLTQQIGNARLLGHIGAHEAMLTANRLQLSKRLFGNFLVAVIVHRHPRAAARKFESNAFTEATSGAGNESRAAVKLRHLLLKEIRGMLVIGEIASDADAVATDA